MPRLQRRAGCPHGFTALDDARPCAGRSSGSSTPGAAPPPSHVRSRCPAVVLACFFLSGASGLIFELVWTRQLTLVFGSTTLAISTVLATFMGGLGLGSFLAGRFADRLRDPVRAYALAELAIGAVRARWSPGVLGLYPALNRWLWTSLGDRYALLSVLRFAALGRPGPAGPTTSWAPRCRSWRAASSRRPHELGAARAVELGRLYAREPLRRGGRVLPGRLRLPARLRRAHHQHHRRRPSTSRWPRAILAARAAAPPPHPRPRSDELTAEARPASAAEPSPPRAPAAAAARRVVLVAFAVAGATAMTLQVLWTRALAVVIGSSVFSFTLILLAFLVGLGGGSAVFGRLADRDAAPGALARPPPPGHRGRGGPVLPRHGRAALLLRLAARLDPRQRRRDPGLPVPRRLRLRSCPPPS